MHYQTFHILCQKIKQNSSLSAVCASPVTAAFTQLSGLLRTARCNPLSLELSHTRPPFTHHVFDAAVLALRVLPDGDQVDIGVRSLVALDGDAGPHVCVQVKGLPEQQVHGGVTCSDGCLQGSWWRKKNVKNKKHWRAGIFQEICLKVTDTCRPFRPILLWSMDSLASGGIIHLPPGPFIAVTFLSSHVIGAFRGKFYLETDPKPISASHLTLLE